MIWIVNKNLHLSLLVVVDNLRLIYGYVLYAEYTVITHFNTLQIILCFYLNCSSDNEDLDETEMTDIIVLNASRHVMSRRVFE